MNTRARWTIGILAALVIGLVVGLIIVLGDDNNDKTTTSVPVGSISTAAPQTTSETTTQGTIATTTNQSGGTPGPELGRQHYVWRLRRPLAVGRRCARRRPTCPAGRAPAVWCTRGCLQARRNFSSIDTEVRVQLDPERSHPLRPLSRRPEGLGLRPLD